MSIKDITVIIATFKSEEKVKDCLNTIDSSCKVIIVENSNNTEFKKNIESQFINVDCVLTGRNLGYGHANNIGIKKILTKYALILNPDTTVHPQALNNFLKTTKKINEFAIMAPYIQEAKSEKPINNVPVSTTNVKGFAMFFKVSEFKDVGFFDERFFFYFEEIDLCRRLINKGKKIYLVPDIQITHQGAQSHNKSINKEMELSRNWHWMWSTFIYHKKYKGFLLSFLIILPKLVSAAIKILVYSIMLNTEKKNIYYQRLSGLTNAIIGKTSWYRPNV